jgi:hypothetical protein
VARIASKIERACFEVMRESGYLLFHSSVVKWFGGNVKAIYEGQNQKEIYSRHGCGSPYDNNQSGSFG